MEQRAAEPRDLHLCNSREARSSPSCALTVAGAMRCTGSAPACCSFACRAGGGSDALPALPTPALTGPADVIFLVRRFHTMAARPRRPRLWRHAAGAAREGQWVKAKMLDASLMPGRPLTRRDLDAVAPQVPVFALESNGHVAYVNSKAIELAKVTRDTPDPPQARFGRDPDGELNDRLDEPPAFQPFMSVLPKPSGSEFVRFLRADLDDVSSRGCTALHDCGIGGLYAEGDIALIEAAMKTDPGVRHAGLLVSTHMRKWRELGLRPGEHSPRFTLNGIKAWSDGSNQGGTGFQREPYLGGSNRGALNYRPEEIEQVVRECHDEGWQLGIHANGDAAIDVTLDAFERGTRGAGGHKLRHRIEHCSILHDDQIARMKALGISP